jgi:hypothetical protein
MTPEQEDEDKPFLQRWSRRKREPEPAESNTQVPAPAEPDLLPAGDAGEGDEERRLLLQKNCEAAEAIDLESLDASSDYSPFFRDGVPKVLKSAAMRVLWRSSPVFANVDGLNDYDEDFGSPELIKKFTGSAWKVGKGYFREEDVPSDAADVADVVAREADPADTGEPEPADATADAEPVEEDVAARAGNDQPKADEPEAMPDEPEDPPETVHAEAAKPVDETPRKVPLRSRLALDDWETG